MEHPSPAAHPGACLLVTASEVHQVLDMATCIAAVESAFRDSAQPGAVAPATTGVHAPDGTFHVKAALAPRAPPRFVAKVNANFPRNAIRHGLPTIQGLAILCDAATGTPLAVMDSGSLTAIRTGAATGVAARYLAVGDAGRVAIVGCGTQALAQLQALRIVRPVREVHVFDARPESADAFAHVVRALGLDARAHRSLGGATRGCEIVVTATTATRPFLERSHLAPGTLVAAVGADNPGKSEILPDVMSAAAVVTDQTAQCATMGDLHHAVAAGAMRASDVRAELGMVVAGLAPGRRDDGEVVVFDSTGLAIQDVAAATAVHDRLATMAGARRFAFAS